MWGGSTFDEKDCMTDGEVCKKESGVIDSGVFYVDLFFIFLHVIGMVSRCFLPRFYI